MTQGKAPGFLLAQEGQGALIPLTPFKKGGISPSLQLSPSRGEKTLFAGVVVPE